jgi:glycosyltransferase involved in cell wall biosynthesis
VPTPKLIRITTVPKSLRRLLKGQLRYMNDDFDVLAVASSGNAVAEVIENEGVPFYTVEMTRTISPWKDIKAVWKLYRFFKTEKPLIVHSHTPKAGIVGMLAARLAGVPFRLHTVAGMPLLLAKGNKRRLLDTIEKLTYAFATKVYPNSFGLYDIILENKYAPKEKLMVIGKGSSNGIDTTYFDPGLISEEQKNKTRETLGIQKGDIIYVFIGRLVKDKGINELISAFKKINEKYPDTKLLIVGGGLDKYLNPVLPLTEKEMDENNDIILTGYQYDVRPYLAIADVLTFPSYREGFPNVVMQAGAMGIPAIVTDINGCNEIVKEGINGWIIPSQDENSLYQKMEYLYLNPAELKRAALNSRNMICENYEQKYVWEELRKEYFRLIN